MKLQLFVLLLPFYFGFSQEISGYVYDENKKLLDYSNVLIKNDKGVIQEYTTSRKGEYKINLMNIYPKLLIEVQSNGYISDTTYIDKPKKNKNYRLDFYLKKDTTLYMLDDLIIIAKKRKFKIKKDTVAFNVDSYRDGSERKIEDIIKKLPGIDVDKNTGLIKYKNIPIENVTLDGDDLFNHNYTLGTKNINVDMVKEIEAIENYSKNTLLAGIEKRDKVSLNLKLKDKTDFSGNIDIGIGETKSSIDAFDLNTNLLGITKNYKSFSTISYNNIGKNRSPFNYFSNHKSIEEIKERRFLAEKLIPKIFFPSIIDNEKMNLNNQYFGNYNALSKINNRLTLRYNLYYLNDIITRELFFERKYLINDENSFLTADHNFTEEKPIQYRGDIEIKYNSSKNSLLEYNIKVKEENIKNPSSIFSNNFNFKSYAATKDTHLKQGLLYTYKISNNKALQTSIIQSTNKISQEYQLSSYPKNHDTNNHYNQKVNYRKNYLESEAKILGINKQKNKYHIAVGISYDSNNIQTKLQNLKPNNSKKNDVNYIAKNVYNTGSYQLNFGKWEILPSYSFSYFKQQLSNNEIKTKYNIIFEPLFNIKYKLNDISHLSGGINITKNTNVGKYLFENDVLIGNRLIIKTTPSIELQKTSNYRASYYLNDIYNLLEIKADINYQNKKGNFFANSLINENTVLINYFYLPKNNNNLKLEISVSKYIKFLKSIIKINSNHSILQYKNIVNHSKLRTNTSKVTDLSLLFKTSFNKYINFENTLNFTKITSESKNENQFNNKTLRNTSEITLNFKYKWVISISSQYFLPNLNDIHKKYIFINSKVKYKPKNKKYEFNFSVNNLLNSNNFEQIETSDFSTNIYRTNILPRYFLLSMTYNF